MKPLPLAGAVALLALLAWRRRRLEPTVLIGGALVATGMLVYGSGLIDLPNLEQLIEDAGEKLGRWTYLVVAVLAFLETGAFVGLLAPGETFMVFGGVVAGQGHIELVTLISLVWAAAVAGDVVSFLLGRRLGRAFLVKHGSKVQITEERLHHVERFFDRHGGKAVLVGRFVGLVRAIAPFLAGSSKMPLSRFLPYDVIGAGLWASTFVVLGYVFWQSFGTVVDYAEKGALTLGSVITVVVGAIWLRRWLRDEHNRARAREWIGRQARRPLLRPFAVVLGPLWRRTRTARRFVWGRITPGELGLELTTLAAVFAVGAFAFVGLLLTLGEQRFTAGDLRALDLANDLRADQLVDAAKLVTHLGDFTVVAVACVLTALLLIWRRLLVEAMTLLFALVLTNIAVHAVKAEEDRDRPLRPLVDSEGQSFPSGHAAYAVAWVAIAVMIGRVLPGIARGAALVIAAVVVVAAVAATRVYLRVHFFSDVAAGAGLAAAIFAVCGMAALVVSHLRQNARR